MSIESPRKLIVKPETMRGGDLLQTPPIQRHRSKSDSFELGMMSQSPDSKISEMFSGLNISGLTVQVDMPSVCPWKIPSAPKNQEEAIKKVNTTALSLMKEKSDDCPNKN
jgi:hypothetical protein